MMLFEGLAPKSIAMFGGETPPLQKMES